MNISEGWMLASRVRIGERIYLQSDSKGHVLLLIKDVLYEPDDVVPPAHYPEMAQEKKHDARAVVTKCAIHEYGPNRARWPEIARSFVEANLEASK
ncbi:MAG: hypothetical protein ABI771_18205 [Betaproteobacteria bacterium]